MGAYRKVLNPVLEKGYISKLSFSLETKENIEVKDFCILFNFVTN